MKVNDFLSVRDVAQLAQLFSMTSKELGHLVFDMAPEYRYHGFEIPKKSGGYRQIKSPNKRIKALQQQLADVLRRIYRPPAAVHGFVRGRSITTGARQHVAASFVLNVDIEDFFGSITFKRVRGLFLAEPLALPWNVAVVLAQICTDGESLPQGAPTSPVVANMVSKRLDAQLSNLARISGSTYTRYVDDLTFSFRCDRQALPQSIVVASGPSCAPGAMLTEILSTNGFTLNTAKTRLSPASRRLEVTGLSVNDFPSVGREFVREIRAMLHSWEQDGLEEAQLKFWAQYDTRHRASGTPSSFIHHVQGMISHFHAVRGNDRGQYNRLAARYNKLVPKKQRLKLLAETLPPAVSPLHVRHALWVVETNMSQGTGFSITADHVLTCAHVIGDLAKKRRHPGLFAYRAEINKRERLKLVWVDWDRDLALCRLHGRSELEYPAFRIRLLSRTSRNGCTYFYSGYPNHAQGKPVVTDRCRIIRRYNTIHGAEVFDVDCQFAEGASGGPVVDSTGRLAGVVERHQTEDGGNANRAVAVTEVLRFLSETEVDMGAVS